MSSSACVDARGLRLRHDDMAVENFSDSLGKAGFRMPDDEHRKSHGAKVMAVSSNRFALGCQTEVHRMQVDDVRAQPQSASMNEAYVRVLCSKNMFAHAVPSSSFPGALFLNSSVRARM